MLKITSVLRGSPAHRAGIRKGDVIVSLGGEPAVDFIDYEYFTSSDCIEVEFKKPNGRIKTAVIEKDECEDLGVDFDDPVCRACCNKCVFCFVDQLPKGMRDTLYFKDDDWRMSFLMGNYVTLSNVSDSEFSRILRRKTSPLFISVHATDPGVRSFILGRKNADILPRLKALKDNGIKFDCQAVLAAGINDGDVLKRTIEDLAPLIPYARSLALVPVGLTAHREGLYPLSVLNKDQAAAIIDMAESYAEGFLKQYGTRFVFCSDELYMRADRALPPVAHYEELLQKEDGVGLVSSFMAEAEEALKEAKTSRCSELSIACGADIAPMFSVLASKCSEKLGVRLSVYPIINNFFGHTVTVSGLMTGRDIAEQLKGKPLGEALLISATALRRFEDVFLDGVTLEEICGILKTEVRPVEPDGALFIEAITG